MTHFYVASFECIGALGPEFSKLIELAVDQARVRTMGADLYHWSAMSFERFWRGVFTARIMHWMTATLQGASSYAMSARGVDAVEDPSRVHVGQHAM